MKLKNLFSLKNVLYILIMLSMLSCQTDEEIENLLVQDAERNYDKANNLSIYEGNCKELGANESQLCSDFSEKTRDIFPSIELDGRSDYHILYQLEKRYQLDTQTLLNTKWGFQRLDGRIVNYPNDGLSNQNNEMGYEVINFNNEEGFEYRILGKRPESESWESIYHFWCKNDNDSITSKYIFQNDINFKNLVQICE